MEKITLLKDYEKTTHAGGRPRMGKITLLEDREKTMYTGERPRMRKITLLKDYEKTTNARRRPHMGKITFCSLEDQPTCNINLNERLAHLEYQIRSLAKDHHGSHETQLGRS